MMYKSIVPPFLAMGSPLDSIANYDAGLKFCLHDIDQHHENSQAALNIDKGDNAIGEASHNTDDTSEVVYNPVLLLCLFCCFTCA